VNIVQAAKIAESPPDLKQIYADIDKSYNSTVEPIFINKCAPCHSLQVESPWYAKIPIVHWVVESDRTEAQKHLEISKGFPFEGHGTPKED
jgi:hypothetical protein